METSPPQKKWSKRENPILKTWKKMKSFGNKNINPNPSRPPASASSSSSAAAPSFTKSRSWNCPSPQSDHQEETAKPKNKKGRATMVAPNGCFTVYVGPKKERFVVKTKLANHPMFVELLEDAEEVYGYRSEGPIVLPCEVDLFFKVLAEMEALDDEVEEDMNNLPGCGLCSPYRSYGGDTNSTAMKRYGSYKVLRTSSTFKLNSA